MHTAIGEKSIAVRLINRCVHVTLSAMVVVIVLAPAGLAQQRHPLGWRMSALTGPLNADRPGFSTSPQTVTRGHLQFEGGYQFTVDDEGQDVADHTLPLLLFRTGLLDNLELRLSWAGVSWTEVDDNTNRDINDMSIGFKVKVYDASGLVAMPVRLRPGMRC